MTNLIMQEGFGALGVVPPKYNPANDNVEGGGRPEGWTDEDDDDAEAQRNAEIDYRGHSDITPRLAWPRGRAGSGVGMAGLRQIAEERRLNEKAISVIDRSGNVTHHPVPDGWGSAGAYDDGWGFFHAKPLPVATQLAGTRLVILESPYAGNIEINVDYARKCVLDSLLRGEAPMASHLLYTQPGILDDNDPEQRSLGIDAGLAWRRVADASVVYTDLGISRGMQYGIEAALKAGRPVEYRRLRDTGRVN